MRRIALLVMLAGTLDAAEHVELPGSPFKIAVSSDGEWVYASMAGQKPGLAVLHQSKLVATMKSPAPLTGLVLTHDGKTLIATNGHGVEFIKAGEKPTVESELEEAATGSVYLNITADDKTLFVSNERAQSISVIDFEKRSIIGRIPVGNAPIALTFSKDEHWLYTTSQAATEDWNWPALCESENPAVRPGKHPKGAVIVIDVTLAKKDPAHAIASKVEAGCNPVRLALSPNGERAYVSARKDNQLLVFDTSHFARLAGIPVGTAPVPVAVVNDGGTILVGNSNRFGAGEKKPESISVIDAATNKVIGTLPSGSFPRDLVVSPDGRKLYVANFGSNSIDIWDAAHLPVNPSK